MVEHFAIRCLIEFQDHSDTELSEIAKSYTYGDHCGNKHVRFALPIACRPGSLALPGFDPAESQAKIASLQLLAYRVAS